MIKVPRGNIKFQYSSIPYDTDPKSVKLVLKTDKKELEKMLLERNDPFWLAVFGPDEYDWGRFPWKNLTINIRARKNSNIFEVYLRSQDYDKKCAQVRADYLSERWAYHLERDAPQIKDILKFVHDKNLNLPEIDFKNINPEYIVTGVVDGLGMGLDEKIKDLVEILNQLDIHTTASCEGHADRALNFPWIDITMISLPKLLGLIERLNNPQFLSLTISPRVDEFRFEPQEDWKLKDGQNIFEKLNLEIRSFLPK